MSEPVNHAERIEFLVRRRFPNVGMLRVFPSLNSRSPVPDTTKLREGVAAFRSELAELSPQDVLVRYDAEQAKEREEIRQRRDREEQKMFYNQPRPIGHWMKRLRSLSGRRPKSSSGIS